ncbi:MAG: class I SAM-dependent methyltransferase [Polyangiales bacterium]
MASPSASTPATGTATTSATGIATEAAPGAIPSKPASAMQMRKVDVPPNIAQVVAAPDRSEDDRKLDTGRHPGETLAFFSIAPGQRVAEIAAGGGYTSELLARAVAPNGVVYGDNSKWILERFAEGPWSARLAKPVNKSVVRLDREFDDPIPETVHDLDAVLCVLFYHDTVWMKTDREKMNKMVFRALKHGGVYGIIDHNARPGSGISEVQTLHRIEESFVASEVQRAGFTLAAEADFLRNPSDPRDWNASPMKAGEKRGQSDRFVLKFVKP